MPQNKPDKVRLCGHGEKMSQKKDEAIAALISEPTIKAAAEKVGITPDTLRRWMDTSEFRKSYYEVRNATVTFAVARLQQATTEAVSTLQDVMNDVDSPASARISAAKTVLELAIRTNDADSEAANSDRWDEILGIEL